MSNSTIVATFLFVTHTLMSMTYGKLHLAFCVLHAVAIGLAIGFLVVPEDWDLRNS